jgi:hypothetical protein
MFFSQTLQFCGPTWGTETTHRFGFFEMTDLKWITRDD